MSQTIGGKNKTLVLDAFDTLFNKRDYAAAEKHWSPNYIQHSAHVEPGRDGLFNLIKASPPSLRYEHGLIIAEGDFVIAHGRYSNTGLPVNWIVADIVRVENGVLAEHWDVIQNETTKEESKSGLPMFGRNFPNSRRQAMSHSISTLLSRNLQDVFGENDQALRRAAIDEIWTEDGVFYDPKTGVHRGRDEIDRVAGTIRATHPDFRYQPIADSEELGNGGRVKWVSGRPGEAPAYAGTDFIIARDGRIAALYLFFDELP